MNATTIEEVLASWKEEFEAINAQFGEERMPYTLQSYGYAMVSDAYKSIHGIRPRWQAGAHPTVLAEEYIFLCAEIKDMLEREEREEKLHQQALTPQPINSLAIFLP